MLTFSEHKAAQASILKYAEAIGWTVVPRNGKFALLCVDTRRDRGQYQNLLCTLLHASEIAV